MRSPSPRILKNRLNLYPGTPTQDIDGGPQWEYDTVPVYRDLPCSIQAQDVEEVIDEQNRVTRYTTYKIVCGFNPGLRHALQRATGQGSPMQPVLAVKPRDKITYVDDLGTTRTLFVQHVRNEAGRSLAWVIRAAERMT